MRRFAAHVTECRLAFLPITYDLPLAPRRGLAYLNVIDVTNKPFSATYVKVKEAFPIRLATAPNAMEQVRCAQRTVSTGNVELTRMVPSFR